MLRKPDRRRSTTQTWSFRDGKLVCGMHGLVVQVGSLGKEIGWLDSGICKICPHDSQKGWVGGGGAQLMVLPEVTKGRSKNHWNSVVSGDS